MTNKEFRNVLVKQMITLATSGFGLVAALAWNDAIQSFVREYIDQYISKGSGLLSRFIYALIITVIAVFVTYQLTKLVKEDEEKKDKKS